QKLLKAVQQGLTRGQEIVRSAMFHAHARPMHTAEPAAMHAVASVATMPAASSHAAMPAAMPPPEHIFSVSFDMPLREARDAFERAYFEYHLVRESGSMTRVAERTGLERTHLYRKLKQLGVEPGKLFKKGG
ncbi:MAG: helix-turn-helix domain-containing protein, partial [Burkholderiaceae bacterium]